MLLPYVWTNVFACRPLTGNPLCVFFADQEPDVATLRAITREVGHSETTFVQPVADGRADWRMRIFLPLASPELAQEIPFAGHPLLGSACAAAGSGGGGLIRLQTGVGVLRVEVTPLGDGVWEAWMEQPLPLTVGVVDATADLARALGLAEADLHRALPVEAVTNGMQTVLVPVRTAEAVSRVRPDLPALGRLLGQAGNCVLLFAVGGAEQGVDVHSRVFAPFDLVGEDPATGSAQGPLGEYLVRHGVLPGPLVRSRQGVEIGRPSYIQIRVERTGGETTGVHVGGRVIRLGAGQMVLPRGF